MFIPVIPDLHKQVHPGGMLAAALRFLFPTSRDNSGVILKTIFVEELFCNSKIIVKKLLDEFQKHPRTLCFQGIPLSYRHYFRDEIAIADSTSHAQDSSKQAMLASYPWKQARW